MIDNTSSRLHYNSHSLYQITSEVKCIETKENNNNYNINACPHYCSFLLYIFRST